MDAYTHWYPDVSIDLYINTPSSI